MSIFVCPIVTIKTVVTHPNADKLDILTFEENGWQCVDVRGKRKNGDLVVYIPIDAMVNCNKEPFRFLEKTAKIRGGIPIVRIKTCRLRGELSQGLVIDIPDTSMLAQGVYGCPPDIVKAFEEQRKEVKQHLISGFDLSGYFEIVKYEPPQEAVFSANAKGPYPSWCPKTDAERYQNVNRTVEPYLDENFAVTVKIDGTSMTVFYDSLRVNDEYGVCSRNQELKPPEQDPSASVATKYGFAMDIYWKVATAVDQILGGEVNLLMKAEAIAKRFGYRQIALQFELAGEGIQKNRLGLKGQIPFLFDIYVTKEGFEGYMDYTEMLQIAEVYNITTVPVVWKTIPLSKLLGNPPDFKFLYDMIHHGHLIEGLVFVSAQEKFVGKLGRLKFKFINPKYLLKTEKDEE